jgi:hypothetical protein
MKHMKDTITLEKPLPNDMYKGEASYSSIINPDAYNQIISNEHLYISASDGFLVETIQNKI